MAPPDSNARGERDQKEENERDPPEPAPSWRQWDCPIDANRLRVILRYVRHLEPSFPIVSGYSIRIASKAPEFHRNPSVAISRSPLVRRRVVDRVSCPDGRIFTRKTDSSGLGGLDPAGLWIPHHWPKDPWNHHRSDHHHSVFPGSSDWRCARVGSSRLWANRQQDPRRHARRIWSQRSLRKR